MQKSKNFSKKQNRSRRGNNLNTQYAAPSYGIRTQNRVRATLTTQYQFFSSLGANGFSVPMNWPVFTGGAQYTDTFRYFEVTGWRVDVTLPTVVATTDSAYSGAVAVLPINYVIDPLPNVTPGDSRSILLLPGAVNLKDGQQNTGKWFPPPCKQVYPTNSFVNGMTRAACYLYGYFSDIGVNEYPATLEVYCDVVFYGQQFITVVPVFQTIDLRIKDDLSSMEEIEDEKSHKSFSQVAKKKKK